MDSKETEVEILRQNLAKQREELDLHTTSVEERVNAASKCNKVVIYRFLCQCIEPIMNDCQHICTVPNVEIYKHITQSHRPYVQI